MTAILVELDKTNQRTTLLKIGDYTDLPNLLTCYTNMYDQLNNISIDAEAFILDLDSMDYDKDQQTSITEFIMQHSVSPITYDMSLALYNNNMLAAKQQLNKMIRVQTQDKTA